MSDGFSVVCGVAKWKNNEDVSIALFALIFASNKQSFCAAEVIPIVCN